MNETTQPLQNAEDILDDGLGRGQEGEVHTLRGFLVLEEETRESSLPLSLCPPNKNSFHCYLKATKKKKKKSPSEPQEQVHQNPIHQNPRSKAIRTPGASPSEPQEEVHQNPRSKAIRTPGASPSEPQEQGHQNPRKKSIRTPGRSLSEPQEQVYQNPRSKSIRTPGRSPSEPQEEVHQNPRSKSIRTPGRSPSEPQEQGHQNPRKKSIRTPGASPSEPQEEVHQNLKHTECPSLALVMEALTRSVLCPIVIRKVPLVARGNECRDLQLDILWRQSKLEVSIGSLPFKLGNPTEEVVVFLSLSQFLFWTAITRGVAVELPRTSTVLRRLVDTGADVTIIAPEFWHPNWPVQEVNVQLLGIGTLSQVKQSARWLECIGPEGQRAKLKPYVANIAMNLWGRDLLKQWNTQINIPPASETNQLTHVSERNTRRYYSNHWSPAIQIVQEQGRTTVDLPKTPTALPLKWLTDKPVWVQQWPLTTEKLQALEELVQEQLNAQHIEESTSPWNSPVFVIKKKSGKWRMVTDLRAINKVIQPMGSLQSGIPLPTLLPKGWPLIVIDLKDCFFSIPLQEKDRERFAFTVPTYNNSQPVKRYQWRVLPQGMLNSPTLCQYFVQQPLEVIRKKFPKSIIYHYMDDILLTDSNADALERLFEEVKKILPCWGLQIAPEKIQKGDSINYLGYKIGLQKIRPQKVQIRRDRLRTLNDFQRLFGDISHLRTITGVKNDELSNLFKTLEGDKDLNSPRELTPEAEKELALVEKKVQDGHVDRVDPKLDCILVILPSRHSPTGILMQREDIILEWIFLPNKQSKKLKTYVEKISDLILKGKLRLRQLAGIDPAEIVVPLTKEEIEKLWAESEPWQRACSNFLGEINSKYPKSDRIELIKRADWILPRIVRETPISGVRTFYTDANKQGKAGYKSEDLSKVVQSPYNSVQKSELYAILLVLMDFSEPLNIVTDSQYAERVVLHIETAEFIPDESELTSLFIQLQDIIRNRKHPLYITHIRSHTVCQAL
ncbi:hypothetical protein STEG23_010845 [Scotinomys teguina]